MLLCIILKGFPSQHNNLFMQNTSKCKHLDKKKCKIDLLIKYIKSINDRQCLHNFKLVLMKQRKNLKTAAHMIEQSLSIELCLFLLIDIFELSRLNTFSILFQLQFTFRRLCQKHFPFQTRHYIFFKKTMIELLIIGFFNVQWQPFHACILDKNKLNNIYKLQKGIRNETTRAMRFRTNKRHNFKIFRLQLSTIGIVCI